MDNNGVRATCPNYHVPPTHSEAEGQGDSTWGTGHTADSLTPAGCTAYCCGPAEQLQVPPVQGLELPREEQALLGEATTPARTTSVPGPEALHGDPRPGRKCEPGSRKPSHTPCPASPQQVPPEPRARKEQGCGKRSLRKIGEQIPESKDLRATLQMPQTAQ